MERLSKACSSATLTSKKSNKYFVFKEAPSGASLPFDSDKVVPAALDGSEKEGRSAAEWYLEIVVPFDDRNGITDGKM